LDGLTTMAKFVIAGTAACPYYAKLEELCDSLKRNLPDFRIFKIVMSESDWVVWLDTICKKNKWVHRKSPIVWRELVERGGKGMYMGGINEFLEYAKCYYNFESALSTSDMIDIREDNKKQYALDLVNAEKKQKQKELHNVCILNAHNNIAYHLIPYIACGEVFGPEMNISLHLYAPYLDQPRLKEMAQQTIDLGYDCAQDVHVHDDLEKAADNSEYIFILDDVQRCGKRDDELTKEWVQRTVGDMEKYADAIVSVAQSQARILVYGSDLVNPKTYALQEICKMNIKVENIIACPRIAERRAKTLFAEKTGVRPSDVKDVVVWGNCSSNAALDTYFIHQDSIKVHHFDGAIWGPEWFSRHLPDLTVDRKWLATGFIQDHNTRKATIEEHHNEGGAYHSEAASIASMMRDWTKGTNDEDIYSMGVRAMEDYGISNCVFSLPIRFKMGTYEVVKGIEFDAETKDRLLTVQDLLAAESDPERLDEKDKNAILLEQDSSGGGLDLILEEKGGSQEGDEAVGTKDRSQAPNKEDVLRDLQGDDATDSTDESPPEDNNSAAVTE